MLEPQMTSDQSNLMFCLEDSLNSSRDFHSSRLLPDSLLVYSVQKPDFDGFGL
jgi:hypothetical protein